MTETAQTSGTTPERPATALDGLRRQYQRQRNLWAARESGWSWTRLALFVLALASLLVMTTQPYFTVAVILASAGLFILAVRKHHHAQMQREMGDRLLLAVDESLQRAGGTVTCVRDWHRPADNADEDSVLPAVFPEGETWPLSAQEQDDLDIFAAPVGIFGLLNRTSSALGARRLRDTLVRPALDAEHILARQQMVRWLAEHDEHRLRLMAALAALRGEDRRLSKLITAVDKAKPLKLLLPPAVMKAWSLLSTMFTAFVIARLAVGDLRWAVWGILLLFVNFLMLRYGRARVVECKSDWEGIGWPARAFLVAAWQAADDLPDAGRLAALRERCAAVAAPDVLPRLRRRVAWADPGGGLWELVNLVTLADVHIAQAILTCASPHREQLLAALSALAELDALCCLGAFAAEQPVRCYPVPVDATELRVTAGRHPLVSPERVVPNTAALSPTERLWVITGSNMAGKSTFLRMVGINVLLAQIGCVATADEMRWSPLRLITDLRARDNLADGESYFLAEVRHLRRMVLPPAGARPILGLIDEPFRGTNSHDQTAASVAVVQHLLGSDNLFLLATHDPHLTKLADGNSARNHHFRENLESAELVFDYSLHDGPALTRNALRILELEGYPAELVEAAHKWMGE